MQSVQSVQGVRGVLLLMAIPTLLSAQSATAGQSGRRTLLPREREISLARSAAPASVSDSATVYVLTDRGYEVAARGTSGVSCVVSRSWVESIEPVCYDEEASETIMRMELRRVELSQSLRRHGGRRRETRIADDGDRARIRGPALSEADDIAAVLQARDDAAFGRLYDRHTPYLYRFALRLAGGDEAQAQELVHDAWVKGIENLARFEARSPLRTWLAGILVNTARKPWNAAARDVSLDDAPPVAANDQAIDFALHRIDIERAIARLPVRCRHVFVLHDVEGHTHESIAGLLGIEPGTSKSQLSRARALLRESLAEMKGAPA